MTMQRHYFLRQIIPPNTDASNPVRPIEIHFDGDEVHVGRRKIFSLARFPQISRDHAVFYKSDDGTVFVKDLNSLNGVYVNDARIGSSLKVLTSGDVIGFGVASSAPTEGFVCVLCYEARVKEEVVEISDDDEPALVVDSGRKSYSGDSKLHTSVLRKTRESSSDSSDENACSNNKRSSAESQNVKNIQYDDDDSFDMEGKSPENIPVKTCIIPLVKCDSGNFKFPYNLKSPFQEDFRRKKRPRILSSDSSESSTKEAHQSTTSKENRHTNLAFTNRCNSVNRVSGRKRKLSDTSGSEASHYPPSSYKKSDSISLKITDNLEPKAESNHECQDIDNNDVSFSQAEEIIYISDDESYLDFKSSQDFVQIKQEPEEIEDNDDESAIYKEIFERESNYGDDCNFKENAFSLQNQSSDDRVESIETIKAFVSNSEQRGPKSDPSSRINCVKVKGSIFPLPSEDTDSASSCGSDSDPKGNANNKTYGNQSSIHISTKEDRMANVSPAGNKSLKKPAKILLTDPKPMKYRPGRLRGRDEGFVQRKKPSGQLASITTKPERKQSHVKILDPGLGKSKATHDIRSKDKDDNSSAGNRKHSSISNIASTSKGNECSSTKTFCDKARPYTYSSHMRTNLQHGNNIVRSESHQTAKANKGWSSQDPVGNVNEENKHFANKNAHMTAAVPTASSKFVKSSQAPNTGGNAAKYTSPSSKRSPEASAGFHSGVSKRQQTVNNNCHISSNASWKTASSSKINSLHTKISFDGVMKKLLQMNTKWLQEQATVKVPPSAVSKGASDLPLHYKSYETYAASFYPMIMLEIWEYMYTESKELYASKKQYKKFYFSVLSYTSREDCIELKCESVVNEKVSFGPREGVIAVFELKENPRKCSPLFGYIFRHKIEPLNLGSLKLSHWKNLPEEWLTNARHWTFHTYIKKKDMTFELGSLMKGNGLCYIRTKLRLADALCSVQNSPLLNDILTPKESTFAANRLPSSPSREYTSTQTGIIKHMSEEIRKPYQKPKIVLLQGYPGTGKTHVIIGIIEKLFYHSKNISDLKILVTASSNEAIDEIGCRLIKLNKKYGSSDSIKFVRVGLEKQIHHQMLPYFVDNKAKKLYQKSSQSDNFKEIERQKLLSEINKLEMDPPTKDRSERIKYLRDKSKLLKNQTPAKMDYYTEMMYKINILQESHIVLSTLNNCSLSVFHRSFKSNSNIYFSCCIVDDAAHSTELEVLQPLMLGISKLVLVGDHEQFSGTVLSKFAAQCGFERSMFERFHLYFQKHNKSHAHTLTEQFRMHSAVCEFPSKHFYAHKLLTHPAISLQHKEFALNPYIVLDIVLNPESTDQLSRSEASVLLYVCKLLVDFTASQSLIGIIVSHQAKRSLYMKVLHCHSYYKHIEINTVDGFQGREKDAIILSVLDASSHPEGVSFLSCKKQLNTALTRASKCLIICAKSAELMHYPNCRALILDAQERNLCVPLDVSSRNVLATAKHALIKQQQIKKKAPFYQER